AYSVSSPSHGTLATTANRQQRLYTPDPGFSGTDTFAFTVTDRGNPDNCGTPGPNCSAALTSAAATVTIQVLPNTGTSTKALATPAVPAPAISAPLGDIEIDENATGSLQAGSAIKLALPGGLAFNRTPDVSLKVSNGAGLGGTALESPGTLSFTLSAVSTSGP